MKSKLDELVYINKPIIKITNINAFDEFDPLNNENKNIINK